ncbi:hypothetical protein BVY02_02520 [bacterium J17]|nr:hypothetical protein BVY02_02520 [bacterium J17]
MARQIDYPPEVLGGIYELGRLYYELGYYGPAERIFLGLSVVDRFSTPARLGLALVKLELGLFQESTVYFRAALQEGPQALHAKLGMCAAFIAMGEITRARSMLGQLAREFARLSQPV